jgi:hypothetical protein
MGCSQAKDTLSATPASNKEVDKTSENEAPSVEDNSGVPDTTVS